MTGHTHFPPNHIRQFSCRWERPSLYNTNLLTWRPYSNTQAHIGEPCLGNLRSLPVCTFSRCQLYHQGLGRELSFFDPSGKEQRRLHWKGALCHSELLLCFTLGKGPSCHCFWPQGEDGPWGFSAYTKTTLLSLSLSSVGWVSRYWLSIDSSSKVEVLEVTGFCFLSSSLSWMCKWRHNSNLLSKTWPQCSHTWGFSLVSMGWGSAELPSPAS